MGVSRAYAHKVLTGTGNSTIVSLCKLAAALDCEVEISFKPKAQAGKAKQRPARERAQVETNPPSPAKAAKPSRKQ